MESSCSALHKVVRSKIDRTIKYVYDSTVDGQTSLLEVAFIDKQDGKYILCIPTQSNCAMACQFCHTTGMSGKVPVRNLTAEQMFQCVSHTYGITEQRLLQREEKPLLVSFMGCGEAMENSVAVLEAMVLIRNWATGLNIPVRFGLATMMPKRRLEEFIAFAQGILREKLPVKLHLSLHFSSESERRKWMPSAALINQSLSYLDWYRKATGNPVEIHYTLIEGVNDSLPHAFALRDKLLQDKFPVKFLTFAPKPGDTHHPPPSKWLDIFASYLEAAGITTERYSPPGADIDAACGQFTVSDYIERVTNQPLVAIAAPKTGGPDVVR